ncbi:alginate export family protein [Bacterioplanoides sp.]|uniref:alginate export family protein n=1 Tax=Bacterioplanoides sp. TaxID=2066072 RepID=UPI003AFF6624
MNSIKKSARTLAPSLLSAAVLTATLTTAAQAQANEVADALTGGKILNDFRLRYETNDTEDTLDNGSDRDSANALTLRSRIGYETGSIAGFKVLAEIEDVRAIIDEYAPEDTDYDGVPDPENTEWNRAQISYNKDGVSATVGRQRIIFDNARFIGNVGWRQNEVTFDAARFGYKADDFTVDYVYIDQRNFLNFTDNDTSDHLLNASYSALPVGKVAGYAYLLENEDTDTTIDTYGAYLDGKQKLDSLTVIYRAEYATQTLENSTGTEFDTDYILLEGGVKLSGVTAKLGNEIHGEDNGTGFATPYGTNHKFGGWADRFIPGASRALGLDDKYISVSTKAGPVKLVAVYHDYESVEDSKDLGSEINLLAAGKINKNFSAGIKYAGFSGGDDDVVTSNDTDKFWAWIGAKF